MSLPAEHLVEKDVPVAALEARSAFEGLTQREKEYAYHCAFGDTHSLSLPVLVSKASWSGAKICLLQCSVEATPTFLLLQKVFSGEGGIDGVEEAARAAGVSEEHFQMFLAFAATFYANLGNYKSFGDSKLAPMLPFEQMDLVIRSSPAFQHDTSGGLERLWSSAGPALYDGRPRVRQLGLGEDKGVSTYISANCTMGDAEKAQAYMDARKLLAYNTRLIKVEDAEGPVLEIRVASALPSGETGDAEALRETEETWEGQRFRVRRGDYAPLLERVVGHLRNAEAVAANDHQRKMIDLYARAFHSGDVSLHVDASREWIQDKGPAVESYIGFIETYRDPANCRAEWEGYVAVVNREMSRKFSTLVETATDLLPLLPWSDEFEKDTFLRPDFTSLDVLSFASSGVPAGINIPNYDSVRQSEGFKNVSLGNVLSARNSSERVTFLRDADQSLFQELMSASFEVQVGLHELLGHGSGKLFQEADDGTRNFSSSLVNPETGDAIQTCYKPGETWDSKFSGFSSAYEECRAECVGIYLTPQAKALEVFGYDPSSQAAQDIVYINWLNMVRAGVVGLMFYNPETDSWGQAHMQARYVILRVLLEAGEGFVSIQGLEDLTDESIASGEAKEGEEGVHVYLDRSKIETVGVPAIGAFLRKLQVFKSTADVARARAMFSGYSAVPDAMKRLRSLVLAKRRPRPLFVQPELQMDKDSGEVSLRTFDASHKGLIESFLHRFSSDDTEMERLWQNDRPHFEV